MINQTIVDTLHWIGLAGAAAAIAIYFVQIAMRPKTVRLITGAGLLFTGVGLAEMVDLLHKLPPGAELGGAFTIVMLLISVYFQGTASLRSRKGDRREGDRRAEDRRGNDQRGQAEPAAR